MESRPWGERSSALILIHWSINLRRNTDFYNYRRNQVPIYVGAIHHRLFKSLWEQFHAKQFTHIISCDPYYSPWSRNYHSILHMRKPRLRENRQLAVKWLSQILVCRQSSCNNSHITQPWEHRLKKGEAQVPPDFTLLETVTLSKSRSFKIFLPLTAKLRAKSCRSSRAHPLENIFGIQGPWNMLKHVPWCLLQAEAGNSYLGRLSSPIGQHENG